MKKTTRAVYRRKNYFENEMYTLFIMNNLEKFPLMDDTRAAQEGQLLTKLVDVDYYMVKEGEGLAEGGERWAGFFVSSISRTPRCLFHQQKSDDDTLRRVTTTNYNRWRAFSLSAAKRRMSSALPIDARMFLKARRREGVFSTFAAAVGR